MSDYKTRLKSNIMSVELKKKKVKIDNHSNKAGKTVISTLTQNPYIFGGSDYDIKKGLTAKDFTVKFDDKDSAEDFYDNIMAILSDKNVQAGAAVTSGVDALLDKVIGSVNGQTTQQAAAAAPASGDDSDDNKTVLIIGGAVVLILVIVLVIWAAKRK